MSYKQFIQELEDDILPAEAERRYVPFQNMKKAKIVRISSGYFVVA